MQQPEPPQTTVTPGIGGGLGTASDERGGAAGPAPQRSASGGAADTARLAAKAAVGVAVVLAAWSLATWLAGDDHVESVSAATVDGGTTARILASVLWITLALAVVSGIVAARLRSRYAAGEGSATGQGSTGGAPLVAAADSGGHRPRWRHGRWAAVGWVGAGALFVVGTYHGLLGSGAITWGDWGYFVNEGAIRAYFPVPSLWSFANLGTVNILGASLAPIESAMGVMARVGVSYAVLERVWFYFPAVVLSFAGPVVLARRLNAGWPTAAAVGVFYSTNPYALILVSGGQLTVGVGYALFPWVALAAIRLWARRTVGAGVLLGVLVGVQGWYDLRTAGMSIGAMAIAALVLAAGSRKFRVRSWRWISAAIAGTVFGLLQGTWLVPALLAVGTRVPAGYTTRSALSTFSLMSLADGLTVFHPFWPTMHFIALHSVPALWMLVPVVIGIALWRNPRDRRAQVGAAVYLVFAALVSGANPPFGPLNTWLFIHVPGMDLFRDPSPYFGPTAIGIVVAATAATGPQRRVLATVTPAAGGTTSGPVPSASIDGAPGGRRPGAQVHVAPPLLACGVVALMVVGAWPALSGSLRHDLQPVPVPVAYRHIDRAILRGPPGAVLWVPAASRFAPVSPEHPSISAFTLESTARIGFPSISRPLDWLGDPTLVQTFMRRYDIAAVVVRRTATPYREESVRAGPARTVAMRTFDSVPGVSAVTYPGLTLFRLPTGAGYPTSLYSRTVSSPGGNPPARPTPPLRRSQELAQTRFSPGMPGWSPVGDGNNYLHQTLRRAGIKAAVLGTGGDRWLHLTVRYGAAVVSQALRSCPSPGLQQLRIRYRTTAGATLEALTFSATQAPPTGDLGLPATGGRWATQSVQLAVEPRLRVAASKTPLTSCEFVLSAAPATAGLASTVDVSAVSLEAVPTSTAHLSTVTAGHSGRWDDVSVPRSTRVVATRDSLSVALPPARHARLLVFWQYYNRGWVARSPSGTVMRPVEVDGWANGYVVPASGRSANLDIVYGPQHLTADGGVLVLLGIIVAVALSGSALLIRRMRRR